MNPEEVFKRYDIRGKYPEEIDEMFAEKLGKAAGTFIQQEFSKRAVVCRDNKESSETLKQSFIEGLISTGVKVFDIGVGPTDYAAYTGENHGAVSIQITSSHLPLEFNGFKFMYPQGNGLLNEDRDMIKNIFRKELFIEGEGTTNDLSDTSFRRYQDELKITGMRHGSAAVDKKIVLDTMGGVAETILPNVLDNLGAEVVNISEEKEGQYRDPPNPSPENLDEMVARYEEENADLAIATDMDADRVTLYNGEFITGDQIFGMLIDAIGPEKVVASIDTSRAVEELVKNRNGEIEYTRVGDPFVLDKALEMKAQLAGEPNGHYAIMDFIPYNSGIISALILASLDIKQLLDEFPDYTTVRENVEIEDKDKKMKRVKEVVDENYEVISEVDGIKAYIDDAEVLIRSSGSSSKIRIISEAKEKEAAENALKTSLSIIQNA